MNTTNKELLLLIDIVSKEKNVDEIAVKNALSDGIEVALKKLYPQDAKIASWIDDNGNIKAWRVFTLVEQITNPETEMLFSEVEDEIVEEGLAYDPIDFSLTRQQLNVVKQVALSKLVNESKQSNLEQLFNQDQKLLTGIVKIVRKDKIIVEYKGIDVDIPKTFLTTKNVKPSTKINFILTYEDEKYFGSQIHDEFIYQMINQYIPAIKNGDIDLIKLARIPGYKTKVLIKSNTKLKYDPAAICIGSKGHNVKALSSALDGEFIDFITQEEDDLNTLVKALSPISINKVILDEDNNRFILEVSNEDYEKSIKNELNLNLLKELLNLDFILMSDKLIEEQTITEQNRAIFLFQYALQCSLDEAICLYENGITNLLDFYNCNDDFISEYNLQPLQEKANQIVKSKHLSEFIELALIAYDLQLNLSPFNVETLLENQIRNQKDIADLSTFDLMDILPELSENEAKDIILKARGIA